MVLVRLAASSVNQIDIKIREGLPVGPDLPAVLGCDGAGVVEKVGAGVLDFIPGDEVFYVVFMMLPLLQGVGRDRHGRILRSLSRLVDARKLRPLLDNSHFTLETAPDAHRRLESGKARGKIVIDIN
jgi:NADPH:quinone reductase-like Zn-dependent oxidoreductase